MIRRIGALTGALCGVLPIALGAQTPSLRVGDSVQFRALARDAQGRRIDCDGKVMGLTGDTIVLTNVGRWSPCPRGTYAPTNVASLRVVRGHRGSRLAHAGIGLLIGGVTGGVMGRVLAGDGCRAGFNGCDDGDLAVAILTFAGMVGGGSVGLLIGAAMPAGPQWVTVPASAPVRFAGVNLQPGVQFQVGAR